MDRVGVLVKLLRNAEGQQQLFVDDVHARYASSAAVTADRLEVIDIVDRSGAAASRPPLRRARSTGASTPRREAGIGNRRGRRRLQRIAVEVGHHDDVAGAQELAGVEIAVNR
jgi:hypothetical protein